jgi:diguanylate cyclase (GGDEF)-like protein
MPDVVTRVGAGPLGARGADAAAAAGGAASLRVLLVEDDEDDYVLTRALLERIPGARVALEWVATYEAGRDALLRGDHDACLLDFRLGARTGLELLEEAVALGCRTPVLLLTGLGDRETDQAALRAGAADYLVKAEITAPMLERAIRYARGRSALLEEIRRLSVADELTGLHNRRGFHTLAAQRLRAHPPGAEVLLMYADLDGLKAINDTLGHEAGDAAIAAVADVLRRSFRGSDVVARLGGDEFAVLALDVPLEAEGQIAARVQQHLDLRNAARPPAAQLAVSTGFVRRRLDGVTTLDALLAEADARMYAHKAARRADRARAARPAEADLAAGVTA